VEAAEVVDTAAEVEAEVAADEPSTPEAEAAVEAEEEDEAPISLLPAAALLAEEDAI